jgi:hypothetical protein
MYREIRDQQILQIEQEDGAGTRVREAAELLDSLVLSDEFITFLTIPGYARLS